MRRDESRLYNDAAMSIMNLLAAAFNDVLWHTKSPRVSVRVGTAARGLLGLRLKAAEMFPLRLRLVYSYLQPGVAHFHYQHAAFALGVERRDTVGRSLGC